MGKKRSRGRIAESSAEGIELEMQEIKEGKTRTKSLARLKKKYKL